MSTFSPSLRLTLITTGDQAGVWGTTTNTNLGTLIESAITGYTSVSVTSANQALTALDGAADQSRNMTLALTTTTGAAFSVYAPPAEKTYIIQNASAQAATIFNSTVLGNTTAAGTGVVIPAGRTVTVWSDGTNFAFQNNHLPSLTLATDLAVADGGTGASSFTSGGLLRGNGTGAISVASAADIVGQIGTTAVTNATNAVNATNATNPASGGSFITSSNISGQSVSFATNASNATNATFAGYATLAGSADYATNAGTAANVSSIAAAQLCKAWARIDINGNLVAGYNISSTSGTVPCTVNLASAVADSAYAPVISGLGGSGSTRYACIGAINSSSQFTIFNGAALTALTGVAIFR
jgi:hypothetical protein